jgi:hypothetical protein
MSRCSVADHTDLRIHVGCETSTYEGTGQESRCAQPNGGCRVRIHVRPERKSGNDAKENPSERERYSGVTVQPGANLLRFGRVVETSTHGR